MGFIASLFLALLTGYSASFTVFPQTSTRTSTAVRSGATASHQERQQDVSFSKTLCSRRISNSNSNTPLSSEWYTADDTLPELEIRKEVPLVISREWQEKYWELVDFYCRFGHSCVAPEADMYDWCQTQCRQRNRLSNQQIRMLERIDFDFHPVSWDSQYRELVRFYVDYGHSNVLDCDQEQLGLFVKVTRLQLQDWWLGSQMTPLTFERVALLHAVNFVWEPDNVDWLTQYHKLLDLDRDTTPMVDASESFARKCDNLRFDHNVWQLQCHLLDRKPLPPTLSAWLTRQRNELVNFRRDPESSSMTIGRIQKIKQLGVQLDAAKKARPSRGAGWEKRLQQLRDYQSKHGHLDIPVSEASLGPWVHAVRRRYSKYLKNPEASSTETQQRIRALSSLGFVWDANESQWLQNFVKLRPYIMPDGELSPTLPRAIKLRKWWQSQKKEYDLHRRGHQTTLTSARTTALDGIFAAETEKTTRGGRVRK